MTTSAIIITAMIAFAASSLLGFFIIPYLKKLKLGQTILDIGPVWHKSKQGTPTMGGIIIIAGFLIGFIAAVISYSFLHTAEFSQTPIVRMTIGIVMALAYAFLGFLDDYIKVAKKRNLGLTVLQKFLMQLFIASVFLISIYISGDRSTHFYIPFIGYYDFGIFYYIISLLIIVGFVNATNLTDGIDGLATTVTALVGCFFIACSSLLVMSRVGLVAAAFVGACLGFLVWNFYPAKVFMGDTGSMFLGGMVVAFSYAIKMPLIIFFVGIIYLIEAFSVIIQVIYFKSTGKRLFKMSPIHHHFEKSGWSETKIVAVFSLITVISSAIALVAVLMSIY